MEWVGSIWCYSYQHESNGDIFFPVYNRVGVIPIYRIFALNFFKFENIFALSIFDNFLPLRFSTRFSLTFSSVVPRRDPAEQVKDVSVA